jgi:hypothetical protein
MRKLFIVVPLLAVLAIMGLGSFWHFSSPERTCNSCHEIRPSHETWTQSAHQKTPCAVCHGTALSNGLHSLRQNARRVFTHVIDRHAENIRLGEDQVIEMLGRCKGCHEREYAGWLSSGHSASYADIFLNDRHNQAERLQDDCLRCHGMFFEGTIAEVVAPISTKGPWRLVKAEMTDNPSIPCLSCHQMHSKGAPAAAPDHLDPKAISYKQAFQVQKPSFYDRREKAYFEINVLPQPEIHDGQRQLVIATDARQRLCYQCHAPGAEHQAGTSDDRTPRGVHEGLSCLSCHAPHSMEARRSCVEGHPRLSNCGLDVEKMDTTYVKPDSNRNVHWVACGDCHLKGVPPRKQRPS